MTLKRLCAQQALPIWHLWAIKAAGFGIFITMIDTVMMLLIKICSIRYMWRDSYCAMKRLDMNAKGESVIKWNHFTNNSQLLKIWFNFIVRLNLVKYIQYKYKEANFGLSACNRSCLPLDRSNHQISTQKMFPHLNYTSNLPTVRIIGAEKKDHSISLSTCPLGK